MGTQEELSKGKAETFICPGCGDKVAENEDLIICDDCFREAVAIRAIRSQLAVGGLTSAGRPRRARIPPLMRRTCLHGEWLHTPCKQCYEATGSEIHRLVCGPDPDGEKGYPPQQQATEEKECTYGLVHRFLDKMLACDGELYERILDTPGFAYWFNQLCLLAKAHGAPKGG